MKIFTHKKKLRRKRRISSKIIGTTKRPRVSVFRSNRYIFAQVIDDSKKTTLCFFSSRKLKDDKKSIHLNKTQEAKESGLRLGDLLKKKKVKKIVFDRGSYAYKGRVKSLAEGLREKGIIF